MNKKILVSVIVCTYNRAQLFKNFLESFFSQEGDFPDCELIIVDNNSRDETKKVCEEYETNKKINVKYLFETKQGLSYARNLAVQNASGDVLAFIDDDVSVDSKWLTMVKKLSDSYMQYAAFGGKIVPLWEKMKPKWVSFEGKYPVIQSVFPSHDYGDEIREYPIKTQKNPIGANMIFRKFVFEKYGHFREDLGVYGAQNKSCGLCEDTEFVWRILGNGEKALYYPPAVIYHYVPSERSSKAYIKNWYYRLGGSLTRIKHNYYDKENYVRLWGTPVWAFRKLVKPAFLLIFSGNSEKRFFYKLHFYRMLGSISEFSYHFMNKQKRTSNII